MSADLLRQQLRRMLTLKFPPDSIDEHVSQLEGVPDAWLKAAVDRWIRTSDYFPTVHQLLETLDAVKPRQMWDEPAPRKVLTHTPKTAYVPNPFGGKGITVTIDREWHDHCTACHDGGWAEYWCGEATTARYPDMTVRRCGRTDDHPAHDYVVRCPCEATNPTIQRRKAAQCRFTESAPQQRREAR